MDLAAAISAARRVPAVELRAPGERIAISLRLLATIAESVGALPELARTLKSRPPAERVTLIVPVGSGQARIDFGQRQIAIPAALRDALLSALRSAPAPLASAPATTTAAPVDPATVARQIGAGAAMLTPALAAVSEPERLRARAPARTTPAAHATFAEPLFAAPEEPTAAAAQRLRGAVQSSGLFFEAHLAERVRGAREGRAEAVRAETPGSLTPAARTAAQLDVLARDAVQLHGAAWPGQAATIELARDADVDPDSQPGAGTSSSAVAFSARLTLDLPQLGPLQVRLRLVGATVAVTVGSGHAGAITAELPELAAQLELRGLRPIALQAIDRA